MEENRRARRRKRNRKEINRRKELAQSCDKYSGTFYFPRKKINGEYIVVTTHPKRNDDTTATKIRKRKGKKRIRRLHYTDENGDQIVLTKGDFKKMADMEQWD